MRNNDYNSGEMHVGSESKNRYVSSSFINDITKSSIAILASILMLLIIVCAFFVAFRNEFTLPAWNPNDDPEPTPEKPNYVAQIGGEDMKGLTLNSEYAILVSLSDMQTIGHKNADEVIYPASMTKVMTVLVALDKIENLDDKYLITQDILNAIPQGASTAWLSNCLNMELTVRDLIYGVSYKSGADAVLCLIDYLGISMNEFVALMNQKAKEIGMTNTTFGGAIGMDSEENQSTCRDIAAMMTYAMENTLCVQFFGSGAYKLDGADMTYYNSTLVTTLNNMGTTPSLVLGEDYTVLATKSGLEDKAGYCLVSYIRNDVTDEYFILVTAKASRADSYPYNKNPILDMATIFNKFNP